MIFAPIPVQEPELDPVEDEETEELQNLSEELQQAATALLDILEVPQGQSAGRSCCYFANSQNYNMM